MFIGPAWGARRLDVEMEYASAIHFVGKRGHYLRPRACDSANCWTLSAVGSGNGSDLPSPYGLTRIRTALEHFSLNLLTSANIELSSVHHFRRTFCYARGGGLLQVPDESINHATESSTPPLFIIGHRHFRI